MISIFTVCIVVKVPERKSGIIRKKMLTNIFRKTIRNGYEKGLRHCWNNGKKETEIRVVKIRQPRKKRYRSLKKRTSMKEGGECTWIKNEF